MGSDGGVSFAWTAWMEGEGEGQIELQKKNYSVTTSIA